MKKFKILSHTFGTSFVLLLSFTSFFVGFQYRDILCLGRHCGGSAPAWIAFVFAIPFALISAVCLILHLHFKKKLK